MAVVTLLPASFCGAEPRARSMPAVELVRAATIRASASKLFLLLCPLEGWRTEEGIRECRVISKVA